MVNQDFLTQVLSDPALHIPIEANFVVSIEGISSIINNLENNLDIISDNALTVYNGTIWSQIKQLSDNDIFFANGITIPGEGSNSSRVGIENSTTGGLLTGPTLRGRKSLGNFEISFLETNSSFIDYVMRPWVVAAAQYGLFARGGNSSQNFKTRVTANYLDKTSNDPANPIYRKTISFVNAVPVDVAGFESAYGNGKVGMRTAKTVWTYSTYEVSQ